MEDTRERLRTFILGTFYVPDPARLGDDASLIGAGIVDSTGMMEIIEFVEGELGVDVGERDVVPDNFETIGRIVEYVRRKKSL